jgi:hypothetical protein
MFAMPNADKIYNMNNIIELWPLDFEICPNICHHLNDFFFAMLGDIDLIFGM